MNYRTLALAISATALFTVPAAAVTVTNTGKTDMKLGISHVGSPLQTKDLAAGKSVTFDCNDGCGLSGPWQGVEWAKGDAKFETDGKTISSGT